ncbi:MAG: hypothetical protein LUH40_00605 [Clostridiales bacterium]|nr:hypothetical protein [Clostridiales bacterium]
MKRIISIILSVVLVVTMAFPAFAAYDYNIEKLNEYPVIIVPGYSSSDLKLNNEDGSYIKIWGLDFDMVFATIEEKAAELAAGAGLMTLGDYNYLAKVVGDELVDMLEYMKCNPDGSSKYDVDVLIPNTADACRWSELDDEYKNEQDVMAYIQDKVSDDMIYNFNCDFRMGAVENAERLNELILDIVNTTDCGKVNILCISHGGQVTGTYLSLHGTEGYVNNCVMCMPAMGGAALAYDIMTGNVSFDEETLFYFLEYGMEWETDYHWIFAANKLGFLDDLIAALLPYIYEIIGYWGSIWDFIPADYFDDAVQMLDAEDSAELIASTTWFHENIMANYEENLQAALNAGVNISILTGSGMPSVTGLQENSDAIIRVADTCGAKCAPYGCRFNDGYICTGGNCDNPGHNHLSPSMEIDASECWLPDNTWFVDGLFHGMELYDDYTMSFVVKQLLSANPLTSVYDSADYPQFHAATSHSQTVFAKFNNSTEGYISSLDNAIIITNTTASSTVRIYDVTVQGIDIEFEDFNEKVLKAGQSAEIKFTGEIPEESLTRIAVSISFMAGGSYTPIGIRTLDFTVMNGDPVEYDESEPYTAVDFPSVPDIDLNGKFADIVESSGLTDLFNAFVRILKKIIKFFKECIAIIYS